MSERRELSERLERERSLWSSPQGGDEVLGQARGLPGGVLGRRGTWLPGLVVHAPGTVADRPHARVVEHLEVLVNHDPPTLFLAREPGDQRVRRAGNRAPEGFGGDLVASLQDGRFGRRPGQTGVEADVDTPALEQPLGEPGEALR